MDANTEMLVRKYHEKFMWPALIGFILVLSAGATVLAIHDDKSASDVSRRHALFIGVVMTLLGAVGTLTSGGLLWHDMSADHASRSGRKLAGIVP